MTSVLTTFIHRATTTMKVFQRTTICPTTKWMCLTNECTTNLTMKSNQKKKCFLIPKSHQGCPLDSPRITQDTIPIKISAGQNQSPTHSTWNTSSIKIHQTPKAVGISRLSKHDDNFLDCQIINPFLSCQILNKSRLTFQVNTWRRTAIFGNNVYRSISERYIHQTITIVKLNR